MMVIPTFFCKWSYIHVFTHYMRYTWYIYIYFLSSVAGVYWSIFATLWSYFRLIYFSWCFLFHNNQGQGKRLTHFENLWMLQTRFDDDMYVFGSLWPELYTSNIRFFLCKLFSKIWYITQHKVYICSWYRPSKDDQFYWMLYSQ